MYNNTNNKNEQLMLIKRLKLLINILLIYLLCTSSAWADINIWMYPIFGERITRNKLHWLVDEVSQLTGENVTMHFTSDWNQMVELSSKQSFDIILSGKSDLPEQVKTEYNYTQVLQASLNPVLYSKLPLNKLESVGYTYQSAFEELAYIHFSDITIKGYLTPTEILKAFLTGEVNAIIINQSFIQQFPDSIQKSANIISTYPGQSQSIVLFSESFQKSENAAKFINYYLEGSDASRAFYRETMGFTPWKISSGDDNLSTKP
jgi:hypothetical protein